MSLLQKLKGFFATKRPEEQLVSARTTSTADSEAARSAWDETYSITHYKDISAESKTFNGHYGNFNSFLYKANFDIFLRKEVLPFREPDSKHNTFLDENHWQEKTPI